MRGTSNTDGKIINMNKIQVLVKKSKDTRDGNLFWEESTKLILDKQNVTVCAECKGITIELIGGLLWTQRNL
jgi:hypothetical protein